MLIKYNDNLVLNKAYLRYSDKNNEKNAKATMLMLYTEKNKTVSFQVRIDTNGRLTFRTHEDWIPEEVFSWFFIQDNLEKVRADIINTILFSQQVKQSDLLDIVKSVIRQMYESNSQEHCTKHDQIVQEFLDLYKDQYLISAKEPVYFSEFVNSVINNADMPVEEQIDHIAVIFANNAIAHKVNALGRVLYKEIVKKPLPF